MAAPPAVVDDDIAFVEAMKAQERADALADCEFTAVVYGENSWQAEEARAFHAPTLAGLPERAPGADGAQQLDEREVRHG